MEEHTTILFARNRSIATTFSSCERNLALAGESGNTILKIACVVLHREQDNHVDDCDVPYERRQNHGQQTNEEKNRLCDHSNHKCDIMGEQELAYLPGKEFVTVNMADAPRDERPDLQTH